MKWFKIASFDVFVTIFTMVLALSPVVFIFIILYMWLKSLT